MGRNNGTSPIGRAALVDIDVEFGDCCSRKGSQYVKGACGHRLCLVCAIAATRVKESWPHVTPTTLAMVGSGEVDAERRHFEDHFDPYGLYAHKMYFRNALFAAEIAGAEDAGASGDFAGSDTGVESLHSARGAFNFFICPVCRRCSYMDDALTQTLNSNIDLSDSTSNLDLSSRAQLDLGRTDLFFGHGDSASARQQLSVALAQTTGHPSSLPVKFKSPPPFPSNSRTKCVRDKPLHCAPQPHQLLSSETNRKLWTRSAAHCAVCHRDMRNPRASESENAPANLPIPPEVLSASLYYCTACVDYFCLNCVKKVHLGNPRASSSRHELVIVDPTDEERHVLATACVRPHCTASEHPLGVNRALSDCTSLMTLPDLSDDNSRASATSNGLPDDYSAAVAMLRPKSVFSAVVLPVRLTTSSRHRQPQLTFADEPPPASPARTVGVSAYAVQKPAPPVDDTPRFQHEAESGQAQSPSAPAEDPLHPVPDNADDATTEIWRHANTGALPSLRELRLASRSYLDFIQHGDSIITDVLAVSTDELMSGSSTEDRRDPFDSEGLLRSDPSLRSSEAPPAMSYKTQRTPSDTLDASSSTSTARQFVQTAYVQAAPPPMVDNYNASPPLIWGQLGARQTLREAELCGGIDEADIPQLFPPGKSKTEDYACPAHPDWPVAFFCMDCQCRCFCSVCVNEGQHAGHEVFTVETAWATVRERHLRGSLEPVLEQCLSDAIRCDGALRALRAKHMEDLTASKTEVEKLLGSLVHKLQCSEKALLSALEKELAEVEELQASTVRQVQEKIQLSKDLETLLYENSITHQLAKMCAWQHQAYRKLHPLVLKSGQHVVLPTASDEVCGSIDELQQVAEVVRSQLAAISQRVRTDVAAVKQADSGISSLSLLSPQSELWPTSRSGDERLREEATRILVAVDPNPMYSRKIEES